MRTALIVLSSAEIAVFVGALAWYLMKLGESLTRSSEKLIDVSAGVKAVEGHCAPIGPVVTTVNAQLAAISGKLGTLADLTQSLTSRSLTPAVTAWSTRPDAAGSSGPTVTFAAAFAEGATMSLSDAVDYVSRGRRPRRRAAAGWNSLTPTELKVVAAIAEGLTNPQTAARLFISRRTVTTHLTSIFRKLGVSTSAELAAVAVRHE